MNAEPDDDVLRGLASLRLRDVSERRARGLRRRCHALLLQPRGANGPAAMTKGTAFQRVIAPALGGAWCLAYLVELVRRALAVYSGT